MAPSLGRVMVVDDSKTIRDLISMNLELEGYDVVTAANAQECLDHLAEVAAGAASYPQLLMLDVVMPGLDGVELTARLKATPATSGLPILIVSASAQRRDFELARGAGADGYLTKPFSPEDLLDEVARLILTADERQIDRLPE
ncbi:MAG TPA: response regulator [Actinomycetes bacterium]|nr:response regulator [Actinomycetes bacterium]